MKLIYRRISVIGAVALLIGSIVVGKKLGQKPQREVAKAIQVVPSVSILEVENGKVNTDIFITGKLTATRRMEIYTEVNGILLNETFKEGYSFSKGSPIAVVDDAEFSAQVKSAKRNFYASISMLLPDIVADYPDEYPTWLQYKNSISMDKSLPALPESSIAAFNTLINVRGIYSNYHNIKSQEVRLSKYRIIAPFSGTLALTSADPGSLVRPGQKLGEFIQSGIYELEAPVSVADLKFLKIGDQVELKSDDIEGKWMGKLVRINQKLDPASQSVMLYIQVQGDKLKEGMFLNARLSADPVNQAFSLPRRLLVDEHKVWTLEDTVLKLREVSVVRYSRDQAVITGLPDKCIIVNQVLSGAYENMVVKPLK